jgi:hypothetical protein
MKSIVSINTVIPTVDHIKYLSGESLRDYDIAIFDPGFPYLERIDFSGGGSCISIEGTSRLTKAIAHWFKELQSALQAGKTVFVLLNDYKEDQAATGSAMTTRSQRTYNTGLVNNYSSIPIKFSITNTKGKIVSVCDSLFNGIFEIIEEMLQYRVIIHPKSNLRKIFVAKDGAMVGAVMSSESWVGSMVLLPYFDFDQAEFTTQNDDRVPIWNHEALIKSKALVSQIVAIDKLLKRGNDHSPPPNWIQVIESPNIIAVLDKGISDIDTQIVSLQLERDVHAQSRDDVLEFSRLLYETGKPLEQAIEKTLRLLGYSVETLRVGDLEIDHVIISPTGKRMIGESEGKDNSAIDISKFRQLESNIGEDFERAGIDEPAKGLLFGNGFRLTVPNERAEQFTLKSLKNANRLGSALIRTADLYPVAVHLLNHPENEDFKAACRSAIEDTAGGIVEFPSA